MTAPTGAGADDSGAAGSPRFVKYTFFKVAREWRSLPEPEKESARSEAAELLAGSPGGLRPEVFSLVGIRGDVDFMLLCDSSTVEPFQEMVSALLATTLGRFLDVPYSYLAMTRPSHYTGSHKHPGQEGEGPRQPMGAKYLFVYPFIKKRSWYGLPFTDRQKIMGEHFRIGHKYPEIKINTGYSFGLDDQEFVLAFEGDDPGEFLDLVEELRSSDASKYTERETPIFTCASVDPATMIRLLG